MKRDANLDAANFQAVPCNAWKRHWSPQHAQDLGQSQHLPSLHIPTLPCTLSPSAATKNGGWARGRGHSLRLSREIKVPRDKCQEEKRPIQAKDNAGKNKHGYKLAKEQFRLDIRIRPKQSHDDLWQPSRRSCEDKKIKWNLRQGLRWTWKDSVLPPLFRFMTMAHYHPAFHSNFACPLTLLRQKYACQRITCWNTKVCNLFP